jgi:hypothetical protein
MGVEEGGGEEREGKETDGCPLTAACLQKQKKTKSLSWMANVILKQPIVVPHEFFCYSLISRNRNLSFKKPLRQWDIFVFSSQHFTVS